MKIMISTFHNIRNFTPNMIPVSTAVWDPKWFHDFSYPTHVFKDKKGVYNGLRYLSLAPGITCEGLCRGSKDCGNKPPLCPFLIAYRKQLDNINFTTMVEELEAMGSAIQKHEGFEEDPIIVLLVYEKLDNPCSERWPLKDWFMAHGLELEEV